MWAQQDSIRVADSLKSTFNVRDPAEEALQDSIVLTEEEMFAGEGIRNQYYIIIGAFGMCFKDVRIVSGPNMFNNFIVWQSGDFFANEGI